MYELYQTTLRALMDAVTMEEMHQVIRDYNSVAPEKVETRENAPRSTRYPKRLRREYSDALYKALRRWQQSAL